MAFESPADRLAAARMHMPLPPAVPMDKMGITHVYHNADPIPMGVCTGVTSACYAAGIVSAVVVLKCGRVVGDRTEWVFFFWWGSSITGN